MISELIVNVILKEKHITPNKKNLISFVVGDAFH